MEKQLDSGAKIVITVAGLQASLGLTKALMRCAKGMPVQADMLSADITAFKDAAIEAVTSEEVESHLFRCFESVTYNGVRVTKGLFDDPKMGQELRKDYFLLAWEVIRENCGPFLERLFSMFRTIALTKADARKQG